MAKPRVKDSHRHRQSKLRTRPNRPEVLPSASGRTFPELSPVSRSSIASTPCVRNQPEESVRATANRDGANHRAGAEPMSFAKRPQGEGSIHVFGSGACNTRARRRRTGITWPLPAFGSPLLDRFTLVRFGITQLDHRLLIGICRHLDQRDPITIVHQEPRSSSR
jgi:hypothetical protein